VPITYWFSFLSPREAIGFFFTAQCFFLGAISGPSSSLPTLIPFRTPFFSSFSCFSFSFPLLVAQFFSRLDVFFAYQRGLFSLFPQKFLFFFSTPRHRAPFSDYAPYGYALSGDLALPPRKFIGGSLNTGSHKRVYSQGFPPFLDAIFEWVCSFLSFLNPAIVPNPKQIVLQMRLVFFLRLDPVFFPLARSSGLFFWPGSSKCNLAENPDTLWRPPFLFAGSGFLRFDSPVFFFS